MTTLQIIMALVAGAWRVVDGRGTVWFDHPTGIRNLVTICLAFFTAYLALGLVPVMAWFAILASASIIVGKTDWESYAHMLVRYTAPALIAVAGAVALGYVSMSAIWYVCLCVLPGIVYPTVMRYGKGREWLQAYVPEFVVGATVIGGIGVL